MDTGADDSSLVTPARIGKNQRKIKAKKRKLETHKEERGAKRLHHEKDD